MDDTLRNEAFVRRVRPFSEWPRQTEDLRRLWELAEAGQVPHAVLLGGSSHATAEMTKFLANMWLCTGEPAPCGECPACRWFAAGTHPDVLTLDVAGADIRVEHVKELLHTIAYRPHGGRLVYVLAGADALTPLVANLLLKTLEEPPSGVLALLTAEHPNRVLPTVRSRCFLYQTDLPATTVEAQDGFAALLPAVIQWMETMLEGREHPLELADSLLALAPSEAALPLDVLASWLRDVLHVRLGDEEHIQHRAWSDDLHKQAQKAPTQGLVQAIDLVLDAKSRLTAHVAPQYNYAQMCIRMRRACASPCKDEPRFA